MEHGASIDVAAKKTATTVCQDFQFDPAGLPDDFPAFNDRDILTGAGGISHALAVEQAKERYRAYCAERPDRESDFDRFVRRGSAHRVHAKELDR